MPVRGEKHETYQVRRQSHLFLKKSEVRGSEVIKQRELSVGRPGEHSREMPFEQRFEEGESVIFPNISGRGIPGSINSMCKCPEAGMCLFKKQQESQWIWVSEWEEELRSAS